MAKPILTLADAHAHIDVVGPIIEDNLDVAPVVARTPVKRIRGLEYNQLTRTFSPKGGFTDVGEGVTVSAGGYSSVRYGCKHIEGQLEVYQSIVTAAKNQGEAVADILESEANAFFKQRLVDLDRQFFTGTGSGVNGAKKGFAGLAEMVDDSMTFGAGGEGAGLASAYFVFENEDEGVSFLLPEGEDIGLTQWTFGSLVVGGSAKGKDLTKTQGWSAGASGYIGLKAVKPSRVIARVCNINNANSMTDAIAQLVKTQFKAGYKPTVCYVNPMTNFFLQASRSSVTIQNGQKSADGKEVFAPVPAFVAGNVPVIETDSLGSTESEVAGANTRLSQMLPA